MVSMIPRSLLLRRLSGVILLGAIVLSMMQMVPATVTANATHTKDVNGHVTDGGGTPLPGAAVSVTIDGNIKTATTDGAGFCAVQFKNNQWTVGSNIHVQATYNSQVATNDIAADNSYVQEVNVKYAFAIPEFGGYLGMLLAGGFVAAISLVLLTDNRRK